MLKNMKFQQKGQERRNFESNRAILYHDCDSGEVTHFFPSRFKESVNYMKI
jgi:hypothetical protein